MRGRDRPVKDLEGQQETSSGQGMISRHFLGCLACKQKPEPATPTTLILFQVSLIDDCPKLAQKELLPFTATVTWIEVLTYCNLGQKREANLLGDETFFNSA